MTSRWLLLSSSCLALLSGCVLHTPYKVLRWSVNYNSERCVNAQVESYDHLPLKPPRIKLMRWGYNVGPLPSGTGTCGLGTGHCKGDCKGDCESGECEPGMMMDGPMPAPTMIVPEAPVMQPVVPPPAPAAELGRRAQDAGVRQVGYRVESTAAARASNAAWMFGGPVVR